MRSPPSSLRGLSTLLSSSRLPMASSSSNERFISKLLMLLTAILLALSGLAFLLQRRGSYDRLPPPWLHHHSHLLLEKEERDVSSSYSRSLTASSSDCWSAITRSSSGSEMLIRNSLDSNSKISIATSTSADLDQLLPWIFYHKVIGVTKFFLFVEGMAAERSTLSVLEAIPGVEVIYKTLDLEKKQVVSNILNETWLSSFLYKPCEYKLYAKQSMNMETAIVMARDAGMDWIIHLDTDELIHPAGANEYSITQILLDVPDYVDVVMFPNYESSIEHDNITYPFTEVSLFKKNYDHLSKDDYDNFQVEASHGNHEYFLGYTNGKSAARIHDYLRPNGAHGWYHYLKTPKEVKSEEAAILHYTYNKFSDLTLKRHQCDCKPTWMDAKRCFMLDFDVEAFIVSSTTTEDGMRKWFNGRVVWNDKNQILKLLKHGVMAHITAPMVIIKALKESGVFNATVASART